MKIFQLESEQSLWPIGLHMLSVMSVFLFFAEAFASEHRKLPLSFLFSCNLIEKPNVFRSFK